VPEQLAGALTRQTLPPVPPQQPVAQFGLAFDRPLVGTLRRFEDPPADELPVLKADPETQPWHQLGCG
jgi:hypothetical protein